MLEDLIFACHHHTVSELRERLGKANVSDYRNKVSILIIDDETVPQREELQQNGFNIKVLKQVEDVKAAHAYDIILCDIKGVGTSLDPKFQGAYVLKEMKKLYKFKKFAVYSSSTFDTKQNRLLMGIPMIAKDISVSDLVEKLDSMIFSIIDPVSSWNTIRLFLIESGVSTYEIAKIESSYTSALLNNKSGDLDWNTISKKWNITEDVKSICCSILANVICKFIGM